MYRGIINSKKIKYVVLTELFANELLQSGIQEINCFVSLNSIIKSFYSNQPDKVLESLDEAAPNALSSEIINIAAHYRHFFWSRFGIPSTYYFYYTTEMCEYCLGINPEYKEDYYAKINGTDGNKEHIQINQIIERNINLIKIITEYLPNIYFIDMGKIEPAVFPQMILNKKKNIKPYIKNLIITNDKHDLQLVNNPYTSILYLNGDNSKIYTKSNVIPSLLTKSKSSNNQSELAKSISSNFYALILALTGYKKFNIPPCKKGFGNITVLKKLSKLLNENKISDIEYKSLEDLIEFFPDCDSELMINNYKMLSLKNLADNVSNQEIIKIKKQINNKSDNMSLMEINDKYYVKNPLMLIELVEGEE